MDPLLTLLSQLGLGLATNAIYDLLKLRAAATDSPPVAAEEIQNCIRLHGVAMNAETVISALTQNGFLSVHASNLYAPTALIFGSVAGGAVAGNNTTLRTANTAIVAGAGASVETQGNAQIRQNPDGSISFHTGEGGTIGFKT